MDENMKLQADAYEIACEDLENWQLERLAAGKDPGTMGSLCDGIARLCEMLEEAEAALAERAEVGRDK